jgi:site-specific DNA recombinase
MKVAGYIRVSTTKQAEEGVSLPAQEKAIRDYAKSKGWGVHRIYTDDGKSGGSIEGRPAFQKMLEAVDEGKVEAIVVTRLDRLSRSLQDMLNTISHLQEKKCALVVLKENVDTSTPNGRLFVHILGSFGEWEKDISKERVVEGMTKAKKMGRHCGRPRKGTRVDPVTKKLVPISLGGG